MGNKSTTTAQKVLFLLFIAIGVFVFINQINQQHKLELAEHIHDLAKQVDKNTDAIAALQKK